jgi:SAM-dependent methyltransferase
METFVKIIKKVLYYPIRKICEGNKRSSGLGYISASATITGASHAGLSICDFVEKEWGEKGTTQRVIENMETYGFFNYSNPNILEIGPGTGKFLDKVLKKTIPNTYEIYETALDWNDYLKKTYPIVSHMADGISLKETNDASIDLLQAHGVFVYLPFLISYRYFLEIFRVMKKDGLVIFDIICEECLDESSVDKWLISEHNYPCFLSKNYVIDIFKKHDFSLKGTFLTRYGPGSSLYLVFKREEF